MGIEESPPPCGKVEASSASGGGPSPIAGTAPHPDRLATLGSPTSPQGGGENRVVVIARSWIGTPYVHQASMKGAGCDCLGLLRGVWRELGGEEPETPPPYSPDWAEAKGEETLYMALKRHLAEIAPRDIAPGDIALFRMLPRGPAKHCGIVAEKNGALTLIHSRQNKRVSEEVFSPAWRKKLAYAFRI
jgi:NlpC/P60 family putative phage cell wall peptidase